MFELSSSSELEVYQRLPRIRTNLSLKLKSFYSHFLFPPLLIYLVLGTSCYKVNWLSLAQERQYKMIPWLFLRRSVQSVAVYAHWWWWVLLWEEHKEWKFNIIFQWDNFEISNPSQHDSLVMNNNKCSMTLTIDQVYNPKWGSNHMLPQGCLFCHLIWYWVKQKCEQASS